MTILLGSSSSIVPAGESLPSCHLLRYVIGEAVCVVDEDPQAKATDQGPWLREQDLSRRTMQARIVARGTAMDVLVVSFKPFSTIV